MTSLTVSQAKIQLYKLLDRTSQTHAPVQIIGKRHNAVLISEESWRFYPRDTKSSFHEEDA